MRTFAPALLTAPFLLWGAVSVSAQEFAGQPVDATMAAVDVEERLGDSLPLDLPFVDHDGRAVTLREYFDGTVPVVLTLNYYGCPMLCGLQLNAFTDTLREMEWAPGENFRVVTVSIDPDEDASLAAAKRGSHLQALGRGTDIEWTFLTGEAEAIDALADGIGYRYVYVEESGEYAHPSVLTFASPDGRISRYLHGLVYEPRDVRFALLEASEGRIGSPVDHIVLACYMYDPEAGGYVRNAFLFMRAGATVGLLVLAALLAVLWRTELRRRAATGVT